MKTFAAGALLNEKTSPFCYAMSSHQCIHYALSRPAVSSVLLGMQTIDEVADCLRYETISDAEKGYSFIFSKTPRFSIEGRCMYCNHCLPCAAHIDIAQVNKYLDMALLDGGVPSPSVREHYLALDKNASDCIECHSCEKRCPFNVRIVEKMLRARDVFK